MANGCESDFLGVYIRASLERWGAEFALHRDCEYLGHQSKNMLQVLIEHKGEMPARSVGFKPLEVDPEALRMEVVVSDIAKENPSVACVLRAYYCGSGRRKVERWNTANELMRRLGLRTISDRHYLSLRNVGLDMVRDRISC